MERARNSDSKTHVKKYNRTSGTDLSKKSLWDIFLGHPVLRAYRPGLTAVDPIYQKTLSLLRPNWVHISSTESFITMENIHRRKTLFQLSLKRGGENKIMF